MRKATPLVALAFVGCLTGRGYRPPAVEVPPSFREAATASTGPAGPAPAGVPAAPLGAAVSQTEVWRQLGDTTLSRLVEEALRTNFDVRAAEARVREVRAARLDATLDLVPTVTAAGGYTRQRLSAATLPLAVGSFPDQNIWDAGVDASWELDPFGRVRRNVQVQGALIAVTRESLRDRAATRSARGCSSGCSSPLPFGIFFIPLFFTVIRTLSERGLARRVREAAAARQVAPAPARGD